MYLRPVHAEADEAALKAFVRDNPLGILTTALASSSHPLLQSTHIPWVYDAGEEGLGSLRGHIARNNPHAKALLEAAQNGGAIDPEVMVLFQAPHHSYVTPQYYVETKPTTGKVVPTWNYAAAQIYGRATIHATDTAFLMRQVDDLTRQEEGRDEKRTPWKVSDAPERYVDLLAKAIVGISIEVTRLEGKYKMSQEMGEADRLGVVRGFEGQGTEAGRAMAQMVHERGAPRDGTAA